jgi:hypothetical protein
MNRITIIISLLSIALLLCFVQLCSKPSQLTSDIKAEKYWRERNVKEMNQLDRSYRIKLAALQKRNDSLQTELSRTKFKLRTSKQKLTSSGLKILALATKPTKFFVKTASTETLVSESEINLSEDCDSLKKEVIPYVQQVDSVNQLYEHTVSTLEVIVQVKDTALKVCQYNYEELKQISEDNLRREQRLSSELQETLRAATKRKVKNKFLTAGLIVVSGLLIGSFSKTKLNQ